MLKLIITLLVIYALTVATMTLAQRKLMYYPHTDLQTPAQYGLEGVRAETLQTEDGQTITYWQLAAVAGKPTILYFHGNGGHLGFRTAFFQAARQHGYGLMMVSYRGYGTSTGTPSEQGFFEDARAAYAKLSTDIPSKDIIIYGESIGTGVAVELARGKQVRALVLQAPYTSAATLASEIYWWLPVQWIIKDRFDSINKTADIKVPVLVLAGTQDRIVPVSHSRELYDAFDEPKRYVEFNWGHNDFDPVHVLAVMAHSGFIQQSSIDE